MQLWFVFGGAAFSALSALGWVNARLNATRVAWVLALVAGVAAVAVGLIGFDGPVSDLLRAE